MLYAQQYGFPILNQNQKFSPLSSVNTLPIAPTRADEFPYLQGYAETLY